MLRSSREWREWGKKDPFWASATWSGRQKGGANPWSAEEFYDYGRVLWESYRPHWERYGLQKGTVIDLGCGPGRMSRQFAGDFAQVIGVDVSRDMIDTARSHVSAANTRFVVYDGGEIPVESASVDAFFSLLMLLHLDGEDAISEVLREVARLLKPGGTAMLQIPAIVWPAEGEVRGGHVQLHALRRAWRNSKYSIRRLLGRPSMQVRDYDAHWLIRQCEASALVDACLLVVPHKDGLRTFLFARKPAVASR